MIRFLELQESSNTGRSPVVHVALKSPSDRGSAVVELVLLLMPLVICLQGVLFLSFELSARVEATKLTSSLSRQVASADFDPSVDSMTIAGLSEKLLLARPLRLSVDSQSRDSKVCLDYSTAFKRSKVCWVSFKEPRP